MSEQMPMQSEVNTQLDKKPDTVVDPQKAEIMAYAENPIRSSAILKREIVDTLEEAAKLNPAKTFNSVNSLADYFVELVSQSEDNPFINWNTEYADAVANRIIKAQYGDKTELTVIDVINYFESDAEYLDIDANMEGERASDSFDALQKRMGEIAASRKGKYTRTSL